MTRSNQIPGRVWSPGNSMTPETPHPVKVHRLEVMVIDHEDLSAADLVAHIERSWPTPTFTTVMDHRVRDVEWTDDHPLNKHATMREEFQSLFKYHFNGVARGD